VVTENAASPIHGTIPAQRRSDSRYRASAETPCVKMTRVLRCRATAALPTIELEAVMLSESRMISVPQCTAIAGLAANEVILGVEPSARHERLLRSYLSIDGLADLALCALVVSNLRDFLDLGATRQAADRLIVLRRLLSESAKIRNVVSPVEEAGAVQAAGIRGWRPWSSPEIFHAQDGSRRGRPSETRPRSTATE
jgi:hypothetical protein